MSATLCPLSGAAPPRPLAMSAAIPRSITDASRPRRLAMSTALPRPFAMSAELPSPITVAARAPPLATSAEISDPGKVRAPVMSRKSARSFTVHGGNKGSNDKILDITKFEQLGRISELRGKYVLLIEKEDESAQIQVKKECNACNGETSHDDTKSSKVGNSLEPKMNRPREVLLMNNDGEMIELGAIVNNQLTCTKHVLSLLTETDVARLESIVKSYIEKSHRAELHHSENLNVGSEIGAQEKEITDALMKDTERTDALLKEKERTDALLKELLDNLKDTWIYPLILYRRLLLLALVGVGAGVYIYFKTMSAVKRDYRSLAACGLFEFFGARKIALAILKEQLKSHDIRKKFERCKQVEGTGVA